MENLRNYQVFDVKSYYLLVHIQSDVVRCVHENLLVSDQISSQPVVCYKQLVLPGFHPEFPDGNYQEITSDKPPGFAGAHDT